MSLRRNASRLRLVAISALAPLVACSNPPRRPLPAEVPIADFRAGEVPVGPPTAAPEPAASGGAISADAGPSTTAATSSSPSPDDARAGGDAAAKLATTLDAKGGFLGATFGSSPKAYRGLVALGDKPRAELQTFRSPAKSYGGFTLQNVLFVFRRQKLGTIQFSLKSAEECRPLKETLTKELGPPQRTSGESALWRGDRSALRFAQASTGCSVTVLSKEFARPEFDAL